MANAAAFHMPETPLRIGHIASVIKKTRLYGGKDAAVETNHIPFNYAFKFSLSSE